MERLNWSSTAIFRTWEVERWWKATPTRKINSRGFVLHNFVYVEIENSIDRSSKNIPQPFVNILFWDSTILLDLFQLLLSNPVLHNSRHVFSTIRTVSATAHHQWHCHGTHPTFIKRCSAVFKAEGEPSWLESYKFFLFGSYLNVLLLFVPLCATAHYSNWDAGLRFSFSFIAIVPLAKVRHYSNP